MRCCTLPPADKNYYHYILCCFTCVPVISSIHWRIPIKLISKTDVTICTSFMAMIMYRSSFFSHRNIGLYFDMRHIFLSIQKSCVHKRKTKILTVMLESTWKELYASLPWRSYWAIAGKWYICCWPCVYIKTIIVFKQPSIRWNICVTYITQGTYVRDHR